MTDMFGFEQPVAPFVDIRNTRATVAEEKAVLCQQLNALLRRTPKCLASMSVQAVKNFKSCHTSAKKTLENKNASRQELHTAINSMERFE